MATQDVYIAVVATFEDGEFVGFELSNGDDIVVGSTDGHIWDLDVGEWTDEEGPEHQTAYRRLTSAIKEINHTIWELNRRDLD